MTWEKLTTDETIKLSTFDNLTENARFYQKPNYQEIQDVFTEILFIKYAQNQNFIKRLENFNPLVKNIITSRINFYKNLYEKNVSNLIKYNCCMALFAIEKGDWLKRTIPFIIKNAEYQQDLGEKYICYRFAFLLNKYGSYGMDEQINAAIENFSTNNNLGGDFSGLVNELYLTKLSC